MADHFTLIGGAHHATVFEDFNDLRSAKVGVPDVAFHASVRSHHPDMIITVTSSGVFDLLLFAAAGHATAELDTSEDDVLRRRGYYLPRSKDDPGRLAEALPFARYKYTWKKLEFILYTVQIGSTQYEFILFPPDDDESVHTNSKAIDALLLTIGQFSFPYHNTILIYDGYWSMSSKLYDEAVKVSWPDVILNEKMKKSLKVAVEDFFDNERRYKDLGVPWKRGVIFYGPPGNGKTFSLRALMHSLTSRTPAPKILYVKVINYTYQLRNVFEVARSQAPCLLILEDIDTLITPTLRSYFFNEVDGLENNDGIMMIATTNHLDQLDGGLANRPSRFDRKFLFPDPDYEQRVQYSEYWRKRLERKKNDIEFPERLSSEIAKITNDFSFAYMKKRLWRLCSH